MTADAMHAALRAGPAADRWRRIDVVAETGSVNDDLLAAIREGEAPGRLRFALRQTGGRGRRGRVWHSPDGGVWTAALVAAPEATTHLFGMAGALAVLDALDASGVTGRLKWPNDVLVDGRKIAGVLVETAQGTTGRCAVVGVGWNVNLDDAALPSDVDTAATSLRLLLGQTVDLEDAAKTLALALADRLGDVSVAPERILADADARCCWKGEAVVCMMEEERVAGVFLGIDADGAARLRDGDRVRIVRSGTLRRAASDADGSMP